MVNGWTQIAALAVTAGMMIGSATWLLSTEIGSVRADNMAALSVMSAKVAADEERLNAVEKMEAGHYADDVAFRAEMRGAISTVLNGLADVRVEIGRPRK